MDIQLITQLALEGLTRREIAEEVGLSYSRIQTIIQEHEIKVKRAPTVQPKKGPGERSLRIIELRKQGKTKREIGELVGCSIDNVKNVIRRYGLKSSEPTNKPIDQVIETIDLAGWDYIGGYKNVHGRVIVRCRTCGETTTRQFRSFRDVVNGTSVHVVCMNCNRLEQDRRAREAQAEQERLEAEAKQKRDLKAAQEVIRELQKLLAVHTCRNCGQQYCIQTTGYDSKIYCSEKCMKRWLNRSKRDKREETIKAREHDADITLEKVYERDNGICYLCGMRCDWQDIDERDGTLIAGNNYPSIDHVKPLSKGGTHTWDNVRLACRLCNSLKYDKYSPFR